MNLINIIIYLKIDCFNGFFSKYTIPRVKEKNRFFILDGDQKNWTELIDLSTIGDSQLDEKIFSCTSIRPLEFQWAADGGNNTENQLIDEKRKYLQYLNDHFAFLPGKNPEDTIICASSTSGKPKMGGDSKEDIKEYVKKEVDNPTARDISNFLKRLIKNLDKNHPDVIEIGEIIGSFLKSNGHT